MFINKKNIKYNKRKEKKMIGTDWSSNYIT